MYVQGICVVDAYIFQFFASISTTDFIHVVKCSAVVGFSAGLSCDKSAKKNSFRHFIQHVIGYFLCIEVNRLLEGLGEARVCSKNCLII